MGIFNRKKAESDELKKKELELRARQLDLEEKAFEHNRSIETEEVKALQGLAEIIFPEHMKSGKKLTDPFTQSDIVYACIDTIADIGSSIEDEIYDKQNKAATGVPVDALRDLLERPNTYTFKKEMIYQIAADLEVNGNSFWLKVGSRKEAMDIPQELHRLEPDAIEPVVEGLVLKGWADKAEPNKVLYAAEKVIHFKYPSLNSRILGLGSIEAARLNAELRHKSTVANDTFYKNGMKPSMVLEFPQIMNERELSRIDAQLESAHQGMDNFNKPLKLTKGARAVPFNISQKDYQWIETQEITVENLCAVFRVPPALIGHYRYANYANVSAQFQSFFQNKMFPFAESLARVITYSLVRPISRELSFRFKVEAKFAELVPEVQKTKAEVADKMIQHGVTPREAYDKQGIKLPEGPGTEALDERRRPFNLIPVDASSVMVQPDDEPEPEPEDEGEGEDQKDTAPVIIKSADPQSLRNFRRKCYDQQLDAYERQYLGAWRRFLDWYGKTTAENVESKSFNKANGDDFLPPSDEVARKATEETSKVVNATIQGAVETASKLLDTEIELLEVDPKVLEIVANRNQAIVGATETMANEVRDLIADGIAEGETEKQLKERVRSYFVDAKDSKAKSIARTETAAAFNNGTLASYQEAGVGWVEWSAANDGETRASHKGADGEVVALGDTFSNGLTHPHQPGAPAKQVVNCRCLVIARLENPNED